MRTQVSDLLRRPLERVRLTFPSLPPHPHLPSLSCSTRMSTQLSSEQCFALEHDVRFFFLLSYASGWPESDVIPSHLSTGPPNARQAELTTSTSAFRFPLFQRSAHNYHPLPM